MKSIRVLLRVLLEKLGTKSLVSYISMYTLILYIYIFRMCIDHGSNINCLDRKGGQTPLYLAASEQCLPVLKLLLEQGADASIPCQVEMDE